jgi:hypothetical protein
MRVIEVFVKRLGWMVAATLWAGSTLAETAVPAAKFVDSVGVNIHLHYQDTAYGDFPKVERALRELGVHHVRDGLVDSTWQPYYEGLNALGRDGIKALLITAPGQTTELLTAFSKRVPGAMEGFEAPNELDAGGGDWEQKIATELAAIGPAAKRWGLPVVGPSLTQRASFERLAGRPAGFDVANLHNYFGGRNPGTPGWGDDGYGSYGWSLKLAKLAWGDKPVWTTETGYVMDPAMSQGIPDDVAGRYMVRLLLEQFRHGIARTYLYELLDTEIPARGVKDRFGLCRSDFSPKPAYLAVQSLLRLLDGPGPAEGAAGSLDFTLSGGGEDLHHFLLQKGAGEFELVLWVEEPGFDVDGKRVLNVAPQRVTVRLPGHMRGETLRLGDRGLFEKGVGFEGETVSVTVNDRITVLRVFRKL